MCNLASSCNRSTNNRPTNINRPTDFNMLKIIIGTELVWMRIEIFCRFQEFKVNRSRQFAVQKWIFLGVYADGVGQMKGIMK